MKYEEFKYVYRNVDFKFNSIKFLCLNCGDCHFQDHLGEPGFKLRTKCYRCSGKNIKVSIFKG